MRKLSYLKIKELTSQEQHNGLDTEHLQDLTMADGGLLYQSRKKKNESDSPYSRTNRWTTKPYNCVRYIFNDIDVCRFSADSA